MNKRHKENEYGKADRKAGDAYKGKQFISPQAAGGYFPESFQQLKFHVPSLLKKICKRLLVFK
jgi:hypothetical protein